MLPATDFASVHHKAMELIIGNNVVTLELLLDIDYNDSPDYYALYVTVSEIIGLYVKLEYIICVNSAEIINKRIYVEYTPSINLIFDKLVAACQFDTVKNDNYFPRTVYCGKDFATMPIPDSFTQLYNLLLDKMFITADSIYDIWSTYKQTCSFKFTSDLHTKCIHTFDMLFSRTSNILPEILPKLFSKQSVLLMIDLPIEII